MSGQSNRLAAGGRIDRVRQVGFRFDGKAYQGYAGDTLASALLANGVKLVGRSFKYHRPRGMLSAGVEEPTGLVTVRSGGRQEPNVPAPMAELYDGLVSRSQNAWPSPSFDILAINNLFKPFLSAGFYYKTFMGPTRKSWMLFEPFIRKAAGLGVAATAPDPDRYEKVNAFTDVLVIGSGPAGLSAALAAGRAGARVILAEQMPGLGGALLDEPAGNPSDLWLKAVVAELESLPNVRLMPRTTVFGQFDGGTFGLVERVADHKAEPDSHEPRQRYIVLRASRVVIAAGAIERPIPFGNNDRPGVMLAGAVRSYLNRYAVIAGRKAVVFTSNDSAYRAAFDLKAAGAQVTVVDARPLDAAAIKRIESKGVQVHAGHAVAEAVGGKAVSGAVVAPFDIATGRCTGGFTRLACDLIAVSGGWDPQLHLATHKGGARPAWNETLHCLVPAGEGAIEHHAGAMRGSFGSAAAVAQGFAAGTEAAQKAGATGSSGSAPISDDLPSGELGQGFAAVFDVPPPHGLREQKRFIDLQNDVSASDVKLAHLEGYVSVEHLKRYTTLGMATEQGKTSNVIALAQMAKLRGLDIPQVGTTGWRPPYTPVALATLAGHETDNHVKPVRRTPFHAWNEKAGCVFLDTGLWKRAWYFPQGSEDVNAAYRRETKAVRETVGVVDVSTLGKIDVQGPDAAEFLNRVYVNGWKNLEVGKARYGIMLREDGFIFDDGTTSRLAEDHYFLTTTTAEAAKVMSHLEWLLQTAWPDLKVHVTSVTDQWGGVAVAGPNARKLLADCVADIDMSNDAFPFMGVRVGSGHGSVPLRIHRISFSGELAYEVFTPSGYGSALMDLLMAKGKAHGLVLYGVEALGALRIEKGHVAGNEIDGRTTLEDLGLAKMASTKKPYVGSVLRNRPAMQSEDRQRLVGLRPVDRKARIRPGMILQPHGGPHQGHGLGHVTSTTYSPQLGHSIALGLCKGGMSNEGQVIDAVFPLQGDVVPVEIVSPHFFDHEGKRLHG
ncbi:MAG: sarcosine oxidase subunit alpha family protein [Hyphomicrobiaceae bacterium]